MFSSAGIAKPVRCPECGGTVTCEATAARTTRETRPHWAKLVERWFRKPDDIGVGDSFERMSEALGADRVAKFVKRWGIDCGCANRKAKWNRLYPY